MIQTVNAGCDSVAPLHPGYRPADWLGEDQRRAIYHVLRTSDRITGLKGLAGSGKTTALRELVAACKEAKIEPLFCAPTAAATDVLRKEGFEAETLQSLLLSKPVLTERQLVVLDEAGAVGMDDMKRLFDLAEAMPDHSFRRHRPARFGCAWRCAADFGAAFRFQVRPVDGHPAATQGRISQGRGTGGAETHRGSVRAVGTDGRGRGSLCGRHMNFTARRRNHI